MPRKPIAATTQAAVLVESRRRCCICFGLNRDTSLKTGQISHLDGNAANPAKENLAFMCFEHHDQFDSKTSQSKNFTVAEVKVYREELHRALQLAFGQEVAFGAARVFADPIAGHYILAGRQESAEVHVKRLDDGTFHVSGLALWGKERSYGPNTGELNFIAPLVENALTYTWRHSEGRTYKAVFTFAPGRLAVSEENWPGVFGMNVRFSGNYERAA
jgi:hypothetical protein